MRKEYSIAVIMGDGTGPEVIREGIKVLKAIEEKFDLKFRFQEYPFGAEHYLKTGEVLPNSAINEFKQFNAIYLGAIGDPRVKQGVLERGLLLKLRFELDLYVNLRPSILYEGVQTPIKDKSSEHINFTVIRENTEGLYAGAGGFLYKGTKHEVATQEMICTRYGTERIVRYAFEYTRKYGKEKKLTMVGKTNVLTYAHDLWARVFEEVSKEYPDLKTDYMHVDASCMWMVKSPEIFDIIVTDNMFGDIITDLAAIIQGGLGVAAGANINPNGVSMFEPMGGSAPKYAGKNTINPIAAIEAARMMLRFLGLEDESQVIQSAVKETVKRMKSMHAGKMGYSTTEVGDLVRDFILKG